MKKVTDCTIEMSAIEKQQLILVACNIFVLLGMENNLECETSEVVKDIECVEFARGFCLAVAQLCSAAAVPTFFDCDEARIIAKILSRMYKNHNISALVTKFKDRC